MTGKIGPKEAQLRALRDRRSGGIPPAMKRVLADAIRKTMTTMPAVANPKSARRAKESTMQEPTTPAADAPAETETTAAPRQRRRRPAKKVAAKKSKAKPKAAKPKRDGASKTDQVAALLQRKNGCTVAEVLNVTGWPTVSMPAMARAAGLVLRKEKSGKVTRYFGE